MMAHQVAVALVERVVREIMLGQDALASERRPAPRGLAHHFLRIACLGAEGRCRKNALGITLALPSGPF